MKINKHYFLIYFVMLIVGCKPVPNEHQEGSTDLDGLPAYNGDTLPVSEEIWLKLGYKNYPFIVKGDLSCYLDAVYFYPNGFDENAIGTPINQVAVDALKQNGLATTVANKIKPNANLKDAIDVGLGICRYNTQLYLSQKSKNKI